MDQTILMPWYGFLLMVLENWGWLNSHANSANTDVDYTDSQVAARWCSNWMTHMLHGLYL